MIHDTVEFTSLCAVWRDSDNKPWLSRLADLKDGQLVFPNIDEDVPKSFDNRDRLYWNNGLDQEGTIGVWHWTAIPRDTDPTKDYINTDFQSDIQPTRFVRLRNISNIQELHDSLLNGVPSHKYFCNTVFCYEYAPEKYEGLLCMMNDLIFSDKIYLKDSTYSLPVYRFDESDIFTVKPSMRFIKSTPLPLSTKNFLLYDPNKIIYSIISERMTWPLFKETIGKTKAEWRDVKALFERICSESLYETVSERMHCSIEDAEKSVSSFIEKASYLFSQIDIDAEVLAKIVMNNDTLKKQCEQAIEEQWRTSHSKEIAAAKEEAEKIREESEKNIQQSQKSLQEIQAAKQEAQAKKQALLGEISEIQTQQDQLQKKIQEYQQLESQAVQAVREKLKSAQNDMADFIADLSILLPLQTQAIQESKGSDSVESWSFHPGQSYDLSDSDNLDNCAQWEDVLDLLQINLEIAGVSNQWSHLLSSFIYASYLNHMSLLLAGPNAEAIANAVSLAICGKTIPTLKCYGKKNIPNNFSCKENPLIAVENPFNPEWISQLTQTQPYQCALWLHPFTEDLLIEPKGLWNYAYPVFTECFVDRSPTDEKMIAGQIQHDFKVFESDSQYRAKLSLIKNLGVSKMLQTQLQKVLSDAKCMSRNTDSSMEYLFGLLPLSVVNGKLELLSEAVNEEKGLPLNIQSEIKRYIEE